jgi:CelD/BcsL family acetyltransferase involved in cellulose biosynthesis
MTELAPAWRDLVLDAPSATPFQTFEWHATWWKHLGGAKKPLVLSVYEGEDLVGLMPFAQSTGAWRALRASGGGPSDYLHPVAREGYERVVSDAVGEFLRGYQGADLVDLHQVRDDQPLSAWAPGPLEQAKCLVLELPSSYEAYLGTLSKSLRYDVRKLDKDLFKSGRAEIVGIGPDELELGLHWLFETHRKRWRKRGLPGAFFGRVERFHREWASEALRNGWLWLSVLKVDGQPIGAIYAMNLGKACYYYQAGFDPEHSTISPGTLLVAHTIRRAIEEGKAEFDFLRGDEPYKRRWKPQRVHSNLRFLQANSALGHAGLRWNGVGSRVESRVRARLEGRGLV